MPKQTQLQKAIEELDNDIAILVAAKQRLINQQGTEKKRKPRAVARVEEARTA